MDQIRRAQLAQRNERLGPRVDRLVEHLLGEPNPVSGRRAASGRAGTHSGIAGATIVSAGDYASRCRAGISRISGWPEDVVCLGGSFGCKGRSSERTDRQRIARSLSSLPLSRSRKEGSKRRGAGRDAWALGSAWNALLGIGATLRLTHVVAGFRASSSSADAKATNLASWVGHCVSHSVSTVSSTLIPEAWRCQDLGFRSTQASCCDGMPSVGCP